MLILFLVSSLHISHLSSSVYIPHIGHVWIFSFIPIKALENAFVMKGKNELAPMYWGHKTPNRVIEENMQKIGEISEKDVLAKALS